MLNLYVADCINDRVQRYRPGQLNGTTVVGAVAPGTISLNCPRDVKMDANGYLFIVDCDNHRVIGSGPSGFRCIAGCLGGASSSALYLYYPTNFAFDTYGNMFVTDQFNHRIQRFALTSNGCSGTYNEK
jgi:DNA-binding beta-propeller fold protein YncE